MVDHETILPPPPSARIALWAALNVLAFRALDRVKRLYGAAVRHVRRSLAEPEHVPCAFTTLPLLVAEPRRSLVLERLILAEDRRRRAEAALAAERPTVVEIPRAAH